MTTLYAGIATISWIDPATGLPEVDPGGSPGLYIPRGTITAKRSYRFSNFLEAWVTVDAAASIITGAGFSPDSRMYRGPSFLGTSSAVVGDIGRRISQTATSATFRQAVGCRTMAPEKIGSAVGVGSSGFQFAGEITLGIPLGIYANYKLGREAAEQAKVFPPIWTELELTINVDGSFQHELLRHSFFPSVSYYVQEPVPPGMPHRFGMEKMKSIYELKDSYDGVPNLDIWYEKGWGPVGATLENAPQTLGNPWSMKKPSLFVGSTLTAAPQGY